MTDDKHRRQWMAMLAKMSCPMDAPAATKALCDMLPMMRSLDERYFSGESLAFVAERCKRVPTFGELKAHFGAWWHETQPADRRTESDYPRIETHARRTPTDAERAFVGNLVQQLKMETQARKSGAKTDERLRPVARHLSDAQLLAQYERISGEAAACRVALLRERLGLQEQRHAAE